MSGRSRLNATPLEDEKQREPQFTGGAWVDSGLDLTGGVAYDFGSGGVDRFRILGIETSAGLDPNNTTAFITGLTFTGAGTFTGTMTPISVDAPEPTSIALLGLGLAGLGFSRRRSKKS